MTEWVPTRGLDVLAEKRDAARAKGERYFEVPVVDGQTGKRMYMGAACVDCLRLGPHAPWCPVRALLPSTTVKS